MGFFGGFFWGGGGVVVFSIFHLLFLRGGRGWSGKSQKDRSSGRKLR